MYPLTASAVQPSSAAMTSANSSVDSLPVSQSRRAFVIVRSHVDVQVGNDSESRRMNVSRPACSRIDECEHAGSLARRKSDEPTPARWAFQLTKPVSADPSAAPRRPARQPRTPVAWHAGGENRGVRGVLFDLDDTLLVDDAHVQACFQRVTANVDAAAGVEPGTVARSVRTRARELWRSSPYHSLLMALGFSSWEGLTADFSGGHPSLNPLRQWVPKYRVESWTAGLEEFGATQHALELATEYRSERRKSYRLVADALDVVEAFRRAGWAVGIVTNGPPDLQREKITATGLLSHVDEVAISGELGYGKPDAAIFESVLRRLEVEPSTALMVGDSVHRDMEGAASLGIPAVWCRNGRTDVPWPDSIDSLTELLPRLN